MSESVSEMGGGESEGDHERERVWNTSGAERGVQDTEPRAGCWEAAAAAAMLPYPERRENDPREHREAASFVACSGGPTLGGLILPVRLRRTQGSAQFHPGSLHLILVPK